MLRKIFSHTIIYGFAPQIPKLIGFLILPFITKDLTTFDFGVSGIIGSYIATASVFSVLGLKLNLVNTFFKSPLQYKWAWRQIYGFLTYWNAIFALILGFILYFVIPNGAKENTFLIIFLNIAPLVFFGQTSLIGMIYFQLKQKPLEIATRTIVFGLLAVLLNLIFISYYKMGYMGWFWSNFIVGILTNISYWYPLNIKYKLTPIFNFKRRFIKNSLKVSLPILPHNLSEYLVNGSEKIVMDQVQIDTDSIGKYNLASMFGGLFATIGIAGNTAISPFMTIKFKEKDEIGARNLTFALQSALFCISFLFCIWIKEIFYLMIKNDSLKNMYSLTIILIMGYNYRPMFNGAINKLFYEEKTKLIWRISFFSGITNIVLNFIFLPIFGFQAAVYISFITSMIMGYSGYYLKIFKGTNTINYYSLFWLFATLLLTIAAYLLVDINFYFKCIITLVLLIGSVIGIIRFKHLIN